MAITINIPDTLRQAVESASRGKMTVLYDAKGYPSYMVIFPSYNLNTIEATWPATPHPAFIVNGVAKTQLYIGAYQASLFDSNACSLPNYAPAASINFDNARQACANKGTGWHMMTNAEWAAVALWCWKNGTQPHGNSNYGRDDAYQSERCSRVDGLAPGYTTSAGVAYCGSGPANWRHDGTLWGISDLKGNVGEWVAGARHLNGEIHVIADNNAADNTVDQTANSSTWRAVLQDGSLVAPGTSLSLKWDGDRKINTSVATPSTGFGGTFTGMVAASGVTIPARLQHLLLAPYGAGLSGDYFYCNNQIDGMPFRGGFWGDGSSAGLFGSRWSDVRTNAGSAFGFRPAFVI